MDSFDFKMELMAIYDQQQSEGLCFKELLGYSEDLYSPVVNIG